MAAGSNCGADKPRALRRAAIYSTTPLTAYNAALKKKSITRNLFKLKRFKG